MSKVTDVHKGESILDSPMVSMLSPTRVTITGHCKKDEVSFAVTWGLWELLPGLSDRICNGFIYAYIVIAVSVVCKIITETAIIFRFCYIGHTGMVKENCIYIFTSLL